MGGTLVLPGQTVIPKGYGESMVLYTATDKVECVVDGAPVGPMGRLFIIEPGKAKKVPFEAGRFILEHLAYTGVVRVQETETDSGIEYDIEGAKQESLALSELMDKQRFQRYMDGVIEDFVRKNKPVPQPDPATMRIIERRGYDLKKYGIKPIGWEDPEAMAAERVRKLEAENREKDDALAKMQAQLADLATIVAGMEQGKKRKE